MNRTFLGGAAAVMALGLTTGASGQQTPSSLVIEGTSTVRGWTCEAQSFSVVTEPRSGFEDGVLEGEPTLDAVTLTFPVKAIECGNGTMNDHMWKALKVGDHPRIQYTMSSYDIATAETGVEVEATGALTIAGTMRPITMAVTVTRAPSGAIRVRGEQDVRMTDFGVTPPTLMFGTLKVGDTVTVKFDVPLGAQQVGVASVGGASGSDVN